MIATIGVALACVLGTWWIVAVHERRKHELAGVLAGREKGAAAFAASLGRAADDPTAVALYKALLEYGCDEVLAVRADDDLLELYGLADEDMDDLVGDVVARLYPDGRARLQGKHERLDTPRMIMHFVEELDGRLVR